MKEQKRGSANKYARLYALGPERLQTVEVMLIKNQPATEVARVITEDWGLYTDEVDALTKQITRYRQEYIDSNIAARAKAAESTKTGRSLILKKVDQLDVLSEFSDMVTVQKARINKMLDSELSAKNMSKEIKFELKILHDILKSASQIQLETGILRRAPREVSGQFHIDEDTGKLEFEAEVKTRKDLRAVTKNIMNILEGDYQVVPDPTNGGDRAEGFPSPE